MTFIFAETQGMQSAATGAASLADETVDAGGQAGSGVVTPPGTDPMSGFNAIAINGYTKGVATQLLAGAGLQIHYGESISNAANGYTLVDSANSTGIDEVGATGLAGVV